MGSRVMTNIKSYDVRQSSSGRLCTYYRCGYCNESLKMPLKRAGDQYECPVCAWEHVVPGAREKAKVINKINDMMSDTPVHVEIPKPTRPTKPHRKKRLDSPLDTQPTKQKPRLIQSEDSHHHFSENSRTIGMAVVISEAQKKDDTDISSPARKKQNQLRKIRQAFKGYKRLPMLASTLASAFPVSAYICLRESRSALFKESWSCSSEPPQALNSAIAPSIIVAFFMVFNRG